ncbi:hypothetical protein SDC9_170586 [bioreactor metagenome]|uniref:Uncharacterized protein n=1 Tax=bioreactor metagenome TaxID=1076179 RepID=A0A645G8H8_9ZZZZ
MDRPVHAGDFGRTSARKGKAYGKPESYPTVAGKEAGDDRRNKGLLPE